MSKTPGILGDILASKDSEALAAYIESGGNLTELDEFDRGALARIVRGVTGTRNRQICQEIAYLIGTGMPAYTDSGKLNRSPVVECDTDDACTVVAETRGLTPEYVRKLWANRHDDATLKAWESHGKHIAELYRQGKILPPSEEERRALEQAARDK